MEEPAEPGPPGTGAPRPQSLMLSFLGIYVLGRGTAVFSGSVIDVFRRLGVTEQATRSTLARMVSRDLLRRHRHGRRMYFGLTPRSDAVLREGESRIWRVGAVNRDWDGTWTVIGFSLPEPWRQQRHDLRSRLLWNGFGPLLNGMWISPAAVDAPALLADLGLDGHVKVLAARSAAPTADGDLARAAFDIPQIAARYQGFLSRWAGPAPQPAAPDDLARQLLLHTDWLQVIRKDPRLPAGHLPADWPAVAAEEAFRRLAAGYGPPAAAIAAAVLDTVPAAGPPQACGR